MLKYSCARNEFEDKKENLVYELLEDGMMQEFIELYVDDLFAQLEGSNQSKKLTKAAGIADSFPSLSEMGIDREALQTIGWFRDSLDTIVGLALVAVFAVIVWVCRFPRFKSFMWLGADFAFGEVATFLSTLAINAILGIAESALEVLTGTMKMGALMEFVFAVVFIVIFIVGRKVLKKNFDYH